jgi:hypothetical protein
MKFFQIILIILCVASWLRMVYVDINGRQAVEPKGFIGVISSTMASVLTITLFYFSGAFDCLVK